MTQLPGVQRVIIEGPLEKFGKLDGETMTASVGKLEFLETLHMLRSDVEEFSTICRIRLKDPSDRIEDVFSSGMFEVKPLMNEAGGTFICFVREKRPERARYLMNAGVYFPGPYEIRGGMVRMGVMGEQKQLRDFLNAIEAAMPEFRIISVANGRFLSSSPLEGLTEKQIQALSVAYEGGYYDIPRKTSSRELARRIGLDSSTFIEHRRKAEQRLLSYIFSR